MAAGPMKRVLWWFHSLFTNISMEEPPTFPRIISDNNTNNNRHSDQEIVEPTISFGSRIIIWRHNSFNSKQFCLLGWLCKEPRFWAATISWVPFNKSNTSSNQCLWMWPAGRMVSWSEYLIGLSRVQIIQSYHEITQLPLPPPPPPQLINGSMYVDVI